MKMDMNTYDVIIIGGGAAGLTAGIYGARAGLTTLLLEKGLIGGLATTTDLIENYSGFPDGISGRDLMEKMRAQAEKFGTEFIQAEAKGITQREKQFEVQTTQKMYRASAIIVATGTVPKKLHIPGEDELRGRGISYCATCDGPLFKGRDIAVIGCGNSGLQEGYFLLKFVKSITFVEFLPHMTGEKILQERLKNKTNTTFFLNHMLIHIHGKERVESITVRNRANNEEKTIDVGGVFIYVGYTALSDFLKDTVRLDNNGFIVTDENLQTSVPGIFAAGDIRSKKIRQVITSCAEGAEAAIHAHHYIESLS
jgi:thioredoxin reductase (NADPH)